MVTTHRVAFDGLVFQYQLLNKGGEVVYIGITNNPHARMMEHWLDGKVFDRMKILREEPTWREQAKRIEEERIAHHQIEYGRPPRYNKAAPLPVADGTRLPADLIPMTPEKAQLLGIKEAPGREAFDGLVFYYQLLRKNKVVLSGMAINPAAQMMALWQTDKVFDRLQILREKPTRGGRLLRLKKPIERNRIKRGQPSRYKRAAPLLVEKDEPARHYLVGGNTACGRKKREVVATTKQRGQVSCLRCRDTKRFREDEPKQRYRVNQKKTASRLRKQHYLRNKTMTACGLRKKNGAVETTRQRSRITCLKCKPALRAS